MVLPRKVIDLLSKVDVAVVLPKYIRAGMGKAIVQSVFKVDRQFEKRRSDCMRIVSSASSLESPEAIMRKSSA